MQLKEKRIVEASGKYRYVTHNFIDTFEYTNEFPLVSEYFRLHYPSPEFL